MPPHFQAGAQETPCRQLSHFPQRTPFTQTQSLEKVLRSVSVKVQKAARARPPVTGLTTGV